MKKKEENIIVRKPKDWNPGKTDFAKLDSMTEEEIEANALSDPDNLPVDYKFMEEAEGFEFPEMERTVDLDQDVFKWMQNKGVQPQKYINKLVRDQMKNPNA